MSGKNILRLRLKLDYVFYYYLFTFKLTSSVMNGRYHVGLKPFFIDFGGNLMGIFLLKIRRLKLYKISLNQTLECFLFLALHGHPIRCLTETVDRSWDTPRGLFTSTGYVYWWRWCTRLLGESGCSWPASRNYLIKKDGVCQGISNWLQHCWSGVIISILPHY